MHVAEFRRGELHREGALELGREFPPQSWAEYESACRQGRTGGRGKNHQEGIEQTFPKSQRAENSLCV